MPVKFQLRLHYRSDSYDVDVYACDVEQKGLHVAELYSHLKDRLLEWVVVKMYEAPDEELKPIAC